MLFHCRYQNVVSDADRWGTLLFGRSGNRAIRLSRLRGRPLARSMTGELLCRNLLSELAPDGDFYPEEDELGKPCLPGSSLYVSISHSGDCVAAAVSDTPVGIDLQELRRISDVVLRRYFSPAERSWIDGGEPSERAIRLWTMKEAFGKLLGNGIYGGIRFFAEFIDDLIVTEYEDAVFLFPEGPEGMLLTVCLAK